jgi:hypothetical protein
MNDLHHLSKTGCIALPSAPVAPDEIHNTVDLQQFFLFVTVRC